MNNNNNLTNSSDGDLVRYASGGGDQNVNDIEEQKIITE
jgi:hypothetical protein